MIKHVLAVVAVLIGTCWCANPMFDTRSVNGKYACQNNTSKRMDSLEG